MLPGPHDYALRLQHRHRGWSIWYGTKTRQYWAVACWLHPGGILSADTPEALETAIAAFETHHPKPARRHHAMAD